MSAPISLSPNSHHHSPTSSDSTTPPSETTLADDIEPLPSRTKHQYQSPWSSDRQVYNLAQPSTSQFKEGQDDRVSGANMASINTDYESSAAEDYDSYTLGKYENAEFALLSYSRTNKYEKLQKLLEAKLDNDISLNINFKGQQKQNFSWSALHLACYFGHIKIVELILAKKFPRDEIDINIQNSSGDTPLHKAALTNRIQIVQLLLANGANVFIKNCDGLFAKQLTSDEHIVSMLEASEQVDRNRIKSEMFKAVDNGDLKKLQEYFDSYRSCHDLSCQEAISADILASQESSTTENNAQHVNTYPSLTEMFNQMTDDRGNTLLHLASMRGFKAICVYLLEQGFDPYKKNSLGQSCFDLSSYQLRQLFTTVKPADSQLKKLSTQRVIRFEGPLLKKVRILGWKQIYVVLENGVILLFNNRRDSMNRSRRGYKYLESATCEPDAHDLGTFTVCFSDKSRATFLVTPDHLNNYPTYKLSEQNKSAPSQIELIRQKWIDTIRDHIQYSTNFIRSGLKFNDYDDLNDGNNGGDLATLNHLLPIDTIKSFIHEARAHYSILERHADSLCNLVQSINNDANRFIASVDSAQYLDSQAVETQQPAVTSTTTSSSRFLGLIRPRRSRANSTSGDDGSSTATSAANSSTRKIHNGLANEFIQDNWHCILFHLRLLMESTQNTKTSMGQALALMEHQEQLRQNRIQDQDERCRVLEDSLHALARDHHELEKSISMSQIYHSAATRSMSMSTDLNEYFDAFEDFDDEKTVTPNSMPSDEDLAKKIEDVLNDDDDGRLCHRDDSSTLRGSLDNMNFPSQGGNRLRFNLGDNQNRNEDDEDEDDLRSNCSALTVETVSEQFVSFNGTKRTLGDATQDDLSLDNVKGYRNRTRLPSPMLPRDQVSIWSILKNCIGRELSKITMPVVFNEPLTMLQRACEGVQYSQYLKMADLSDDPIERMELVCAFIVAGLSCNCHRIIKPFNPLLYETYEYDHELEDGSHVKAMAQQVSHHPPITAAYSESDNFIYNGSVNPKIKFWGRSIEVQPDGQCRVYLKRHKETYSFKTVSCSIHNIIVGKLWFEHSGPLDIKCIETGVQANLVFKPAGWFNNDLHRFDGVIVTGGEKESEKKNVKNIHRYVYGKWSDYMKSVDYSEYENYMKENQQKLFRIPDDPDLGRQLSSNGLVNKLEGLNLSGSPNSVNNNSITQNNQQSGSKSMGSSKSGDTKGGYTKSESMQSLDIPNSRTIWRLEAQYLGEYYNFTLFTLKLNEFTPNLASTLPRTDSRFRPDVRRLEEGDLDGAASEKQRLEEKQREVRSKDKRFKDPSPDLLWFDLKNVPHTKDKFWVYKGGYWENRCNQERFPDLF